MICARYLLIFTCLFFQSGFALAEGPQFALQAGGVTPKKEFCDQSFYSNAKEWSQGQLANYKSCLKDKDKSLTKQSKVSLTNAMAFESSCGLKRQQSLSFHDDLNATIEMSFWQAIAKKSHDQATCRSEFFDEYLDKPAQQAKLNKKVEDAFNKSKERLAELGEYRAQQAKELKEWEVANAATGRGGLSESVKGRKALVDSIDKEIAGILSQIPMGYEPEVGARLMVMAMNDSFDKKSLYDGMADAKGKYAKSSNFYCGKHSAGCRKKDEPVRTGNYCLDLDYKNFAATSGQTDILINSDRTLSAKDKAILQCRVSSVYKVGAKRVNMTMAGAFIVGGVLAAIPTSGTSLGVSLSAIGIGVSALGFIDQLDTVRHKCALQTYIISGDQKQCNPEQDYNREIETASMKSCIANLGLLALGALEVPLNIKNLVKARRAMKLAKTEKVEEAAASVAKVDDVAPESETIEVIAQKRSINALPKKSQSSAPSIESQKSELDSVLSEYGDVNSQIEKLNQNLDEALKKYSSADRARIKKLHEELAKKSEALAQRNVNKDLTQLKKEARIKQGDCKAFNRLKDPAFSTRAKCSVVTFTKDSSRYCSCGAKGAPGAWVAPCAEAFSAFLTKNQLVNNKALPGSSAASLNECRRIVIPAGTTVIHGGASPAYSGYGGDAQIFLGLNDSISGRSNTITRLKAAELGIVDTTTKFDTKIKVIAYAPQHDDVGMRALYNMGRECHGGGKSVCSIGQIQEIEKGFGRILETRPNAVNEAEVAQFKEWMDWLKGCRQLRPNGTVSDKDLSLPGCR